MPNRSKKVRGHHRSGDRESPGAQPLAGQKRPYTNRSQANRRGSPGSLLDNGSNCDTSEPHFPITHIGFSCKKSSYCTVKHNIERTPDWLSGAPVHFNTPALQCNFVFIIFHDHICSLFLICALADNFSATFLGDTIRSGIFLPHINGYFLSSLITSIIYHSLSDFGCIALTPKIFMYAISNIVYFLVFTHYKTACPYPL